MRIAITVVVAALVAAAPASASAATVRLRGTAYEFNARKEIAAATIRVAEVRSARATTRADGSYVLRVPDRAAITPYIEAAGYHTIYLQTFRTAGQDLRNVNFQTPTEDIYRALASLLDVPLDAQGNVAQCAIVSTFSTRNVRDLDYRAFRDYGAHGVAGATAFGVPALPPATYFNAQVIPDPAQPQSSEDGGVVWTRVPAGTYRVVGQAPGTRFAPFEATCRDGRVVNANPPWGLYQLSPASPARIVARWRVNGRESTLRSLRLPGLPRGSLLRTTCHSRGCSFGSVLNTPAPDFVALMRGERFRAGDTLEITAFSHAYNATVSRFRIRAGRTPKAQVLCVPDGLTRPQRRCPTG